MRFTAHPESTARAKTPTANALAAKGEWRERITPNVLIFVAGPVIKNATKAPADMPLCKRTAPSGVAPEAHT